MFGAHWTQLLILVGVALLVFGPKRLPEIGSAIGKTIREFQHSMHELKEPIAAVQSPAKYLAAAVTQQPGELVSGPASVQAAATADGLSVQTPADAVADTVSTAPPA